MQVREKTEQVQGSAEMNCIQTPHGLDGERLCRSIQDIRTHLSYDPGARDTHKRPPDPLGIGGGNFPLLLSPDNGPVDFQHGQA